MKIRDSPPALNNYAFYHSNEMDFTINHVTLKEGSEPQVRA
jgi:hypothetical protein